jgi:hypothetical protein
MAGCRNCTLVATTRCVCGVPLAASIDSMCAMDIDVIGGAVEQGVAADKARRSCRCARIRARSFIERALQLNAGVRRTVEP